MFKKVAIENGYEFDSTDDKGWVTYGLGVFKDSINGDTATKWMYYNPKDDRFSLRLSRTNWFGIETDSDSPFYTYDLIVKDIKEKCKYYKIQNYKGTDFVTYSCSDSSYKGKIGFVIEEGRGIIRHFIPE